MLRALCSRVRPQKTAVPQFSFRQFSDSGDKGQTQDASSLDNLLRDSVATDDEVPLHQGPKKGRKPRHPPKPPSTEVGVDHSKKSVLLFPGQGAQFVGMGKEVISIPAVKELYDEASQILDYDLLRLCLEGPQSLLDETRYCQAATVVSSLAAVEHLYNEKPEAVEECLAVAGFSVGELTAAIFTGSVTFSEGINLVKIRGEAMQAASELVDSGMITVFAGAGNKLSLGCEVAREWCRRKHDIQDPVCQVANHLYCGAKVVGGHEQALQFLEQNYADFGIRRTKRLPVSGAFHTPLMEPAVEAFSLAVAQTRFNNPRVPIYSNVDNLIMTKGYRVQKTLPKQLVRAVEWESAICKIFYSGPNDALPSVYECGPGNVLSAILGRINGRAAKKCQYISV